MNAIQKSVQTWIHDHQSRILSHVQDLIHYNTVNNGVNGNEKEGQKYLFETLCEIGLEAEMYSPEDVAGFRDHPAFFPGKDYRERPNVIATWKGSGAGRSLIFSSHMDTTVAALGWERDPWTAVVDGERLYGLGAFDMKGGLAASVMAICCLREIGVRLKGDLMIESVVDEEFGGANGTLAARIKGHNPDAAIIPEPSNLAVFPATRGGAQWRVSFYGTTGMSFSGETVSNPVNAAAKFIVFLEEFERERNKVPGPEPWYKHDSALPVMVTRLEAGDMTASICDTGPSVCHVDIWVECHPHVTEEMLEQEIKNGFCAMYKDSSQTWIEPQFEKMIRFLPGSEVNSDNPLIGLMSKVADRVTDGWGGNIEGAPLACDAFMFNLYSPTPAIILGPAGGNAHAPDEYIDIPRFYQLVEIYALIIMEWCGYEMDEGRGSKP